MRSRQEHDPASRDEDGAFAFGDAFPEILVYLALLVLGALSFSLAYASVFTGFHLLIAMVIAAAMVVLVVLFYMDLLNAKAVTVLTAIAGVLWLMILFTLTLADYATRPPGTGDTFPRSIQQLFSEPRQ